MVRGERDGSTMRAASTASDSGNGEGGVGRSWRRRARQRARRAAEFIQVMAGAGGFSNLRMTKFKSVALPLGDAPTRSGLSRAKAQRFQGAEVWRQAGIFSRPSRPDAARGIGHAVEDEIVRRHLLWRHGRAEAFVGVAAVNPGRSEPGAVGGGVIVNKLSAVCRISVLATPRPASFSSM